MNFKIFMSFIFFLITPFKSLSQEKEHISSLINPKLLTNANAVIRNQSVSINVKSQTKALINIHKTVTVLNQDGEKFGVFMANYDDYRKIKNIKIRVYDANSKLIKKVFPIDIKDYPADDGFSLYKSDRLKYFKYIPASYPYTISISYDIETGDTVFLLPFIPITDFNLAIENYKYSIHFPPGTIWRLNEKNLKKFDVNKSQESTGVSYQITNIPALVHEPLMPPISSIVPQAYVNLEEFSLKGIKGKAKNWNELAHWISQKLLKGSDQLTPQTRHDILKLTNGIRDPKEKARLVYEYMQRKTRYVSIQIGIGGWRPMPAIEVDKKAYGDCKALVNYTQSLLKVANVTSNYTIVYGSEYKKDIDENRLGLQGNHVILMLPFQKDTVWLECTSQKLPFGFIGGFTDNRKVFVVRPNSGFITQTPHYKTNSIFKNVVMNLNDSLDFKVDYSIENCGKAYSDVYYLKDLKKKDLILHYQKALGNILGLSIENINLNDNKKKVCFTEKLHLKLSKQVSNFEPATYYFAPGIFSEIPKTPASISERHYPFVISSGSTQEMVVTVKLPQSFIFLDLPKSRKLSYEFGDYSLDIIKKNDREAIFKRRFELKEGTFPKESYKALRKFIKKARKLDKKKILIKKI